MPRPMFCRALRERFQHISKDWEDARAALPSGKSARLNKISRLFMRGFEWDLRMMEGAVRNYIKDEKEVSGKACMGRIDWSPDLDT